MATTVLIAVTFGASMARFDGAYDQPSAAERSMSLMLDVLSWPILSASMQLAKPGWFPGLLGYIPIVLNSLAWGFAVVALLRAVLRRR